MNFVPPAVRALLIANGAIFVLQTVSSLVAGDSFARLFALIPSMTLKGAFWQPASYLFLHDGIWHLLMNMLALFMFGGEVERRLGTRAFAWLYAVSGIGAGLASLAVVQIAAPGSDVALVGASGAIFGVLMAFAMLFPYRPVTLLVFFVLPVTMQARWLVAIYAWVEAMTLMQMGGVRGLGHLAHLSGLVFGWAYLRSPDWLAGWRERRRRRTVDRQMRIVRAGYAEKDRLQEEVDSLLDKISRDGMQGLSAAERQRLLDASEQLRKL